MGNCLGFEQWWKAGQRSSEDDANSGGITVVFS